MKRNSTNASVPQAPRFALAIDAETINELRGLLDQRKKLDDAVNSAPAEIAAGEADLAALRQELALLEADVVLVDEPALPKLQKQIAELSEVIEAKDLAFRRLKGRLKALEDRAPDIDNRIEIAIGYVRLEANMAAQNLQSELAAELRKKVGDVRNVYAQVRALQSAVPLSQTRDFLVCAHVPDLEHCMVSYIGGTPHDNSQNLLELRDDDTEAAEGEIVEALKPITEALLVARKHKPYVPLANRPVPYVRKGAWDGPGGRTGDRIEQPQQAEATASSESGARAGNPRSGAPVEMNMAAALAAADRSADL